MKLAALFSILIWLSVSPQSLARPEVVFSCGIPTNLPQWQTLETLYREAFDALGHDFSMVYVNTKREMYEHKYSDRYDGICIRTRTSIAALEEYGLFIVEAAVGDPNTALWRNKQSTQPKRPGESILPPNSKVGYLRGNSLSEDYIKEFAGAKAISFIKPNMGMKSLATGRIDYWIGFGHTAELLVENFGLHDRVEKVAIIRQDYFYPFMHSRLSPLKKPLEKLLQQAMERRGSLIK